MTGDVPEEPPSAVVFSLDEALTLLAALEDARDALIASGHPAVVVSIEAEIRVLSRRLGFRDPKEPALASEPLRAAEAARMLGITTRELLVLVREQRIAYVMVNGIAHIPLEAIDAFREARAL